MSTRAGFLRRVNPLAKIAGPLPAMVFLAFTRDPWTPGIFVAVAALLPGSVAAGLAMPPQGSRLMVEHPTGALEVEVELDGREVLRTAIVRTARPIMDGTVYPRPRR